MQKKSYKNDFCALLHMIKWGWKYKGCVSRLVHAAVFGKVQEIFMLGPGAGLSHSTAWCLMEWPCPDLPFSQLLLLALIISSSNKHLKHRDILLVVTSTILLLHSSSVFLPL